MHYTDNLLVLSIDNDGELTSIDNDGGIKQNETQNEMVILDIKCCMVLFDFFHFPFYSFFFFLHLSPLAYIYVSNGDFFFFWLIIRYFGESGGI